MTTPYYDTWIRAYMLNHGIADVDWLMECGDDPSWKTKFKRTSVKSVTEGKHKFWVGRAFFVLRDICLYGRKIYPNTWETDRKNAFYYWISMVDSFKHHLDIDQIKKEYAYLHDKYCKSIMEEYRNEHPANARETDESAPQGCGMETADSGNARQ